MKRRLNSDPVTPVFAEVGCQSSPVTKHLVIGNVAVPIRVSGNKNRCMLLVRNTTAIPVYVGSPDVTAPTEATLENAGMPLLKNEALAFEFTGDALIDIYAICAEETTTVIAAMEVM